MDTALIAALVSSISVLVLCATILVVYFCYLRTKKTNKKEQDKEQSPHIHNTILKQKQRGSQDLFTGKTIPFAKHNSLTHSTILEVNASDGKSYPDGKTSTMQDELDRSSRRSSDGSDTKDSGKGTLEVRKFSNYALEDDNASFHF